MNWLEWMENELITIRAMPQFFFKKKKQKQKQSLKDGG